MSDKTLSSKLIGLSAEAKVRSAAEMWKLRADQRFLPRLGKSAIGMVLRSQRVRSLTLDLITRPLGDVEIISNGWEQIVMADGDQGVIKLITGTIGHDTAKVQATAERLQDESDTCGSYLGDSWLPTTFEVTSLGRGTRSAVLARQERLTDATFYPSPKEIVPSNSVRNLAGNIMDLHEDTGLLPDIFGEHNIAARRGAAELCIVDTLSVTPLLQATIPYGEQLTIEDRTVAVLQNWLD